MLPACVARPCPAVVGAECLQASHHKPVCKAKDMAFNHRPTVRCADCGGTDFIDYSESGDRGCAKCGTVLQENGIVSTVQFSESGGSSNVVGQFVSGDRGRPSGGGAGRGRGRFGHSRDSRETTIQNGRKKIVQVSHTRDRTYVVVRVLQHTNIMQCRE